MKKIILLTSLLIPICGYQLLPGFATMPITPPSGSSAPVGGMFSQYFGNISTPADLSIVNPIIIGFNPPSDTSSLLPIYSSGSTFITNYLKILGLLGGDLVFNGFDATGNIVSSSMSTLVKGYLSGKMAPSYNAIGGFDTSGNPIFTKEVGYWKGGLPGIGYTDGNVVINGNIQLHGNASSANATQANHLVPLGQIQIQKNSIATTVALIKANGP